MLENVERATRENTLLLWVGVIGGPLVWFAHFVLVYSIVDFGCATSLLDYQVASLPSIHALIWIATAIAVVLTIGAGIIAFAIWNGSGSRSIEAHDRRSFMGFTGIAFSLISLVAMIMAVIPASVLSTCAGVTGA